MIRPLPVGLSAEQRAFVEAARSMGALVVVLAILLLSASALPAQVSELTLGTRVRLRAPEAVAGRLTGVIVGQGGDSLVVTRPNALPITLRLPQLTQLEVSRGRSHGRGAMKGALWGGSIMAVFGVLFVDGATTCDGPPTNLTCEETTLLESAAYGAVSGVLVGATIGAFVGSEHWERITMPRLAILPRRDGAVQVELALRW
jgi:hypothetical protein